MSTRHKMRATIPLDDSGADEIEVEIAFTYLKGAPEQGPSYASGGQPADPDEIDLVSATPTQDGKYYAAGAENLEWLHDFARAWLETEDGVSEAMATVDSDIDEARERAAEYAAEARRDDR